MLSTIGLIIDIALVVFLVIAGIIGYKKGFFKSLIALFSWVVCLLVAIFVAKYVAGWINGIYNFSGLIGGKITEGLNGVNAFFTKPVNSFDGGKAGLIAAIPSDINGLLAQLIKVVINGIPDASFAEQTGSVANLVGSSLGYIIMVIISGILVFVLLKIAIALLSKLFDNLTRIKILGSLNKILGIVFGALKAFLVVVALNLVLVGLSLIPAVNNTITPLIQDNTHIEKVIYNTTDKLVGKYVINGNIIQTWVSNLWNNK